MNRFYPRGNYGLRCKALLPNERVKLLSELKVLDKSYGWKSKANERTQSAWNLIRPRSGSQQNHFGIERVKLLSKLKVLDKVIWSKPDPALVFASSFCFCFLLCSFNYYSCSRIQRTLPPYSTVDFCVINQWDFILRPSGSVRKRPARPCPLTAPK